MENFTIKWKRKWKKMEKKSSGAEVVKSGMYDIYTYIYIYIYIIYMYI